MLHDYFCSVVVMYKSFWLSTVAAVQMFFIKHIFVFFMTLFWKKMGIILSASKPNCHSRLSKPILKILFICRRTILGKQLSQAIRCKYFFQIASCTKISNIIYKITYDGQSCQTTHRCSMKKLLRWILQEKDLYRSLFF